MPWAGKVQVGRLMCRPGRRSGSPLWQAAPLAQWQLWQLHRWMVSGSQIRVYIPSSCCNTSLQYNIYLIRQDYFTYIIIIYVNASVQQIHIIKFIGNQIQPC